jgi:hypothetical protein
MAKGYKIVCFSANRTCHHDDYFLLFSKFVKLYNVKTFFSKLKILFSNDRILFLDIDSRDLIFFPLILVRGLWGGTGVAISVRTEYFFEYRTLKKPFLNRNTIRFFKAYLKMILFYSIKKISSTTIVSIHKKTPYVTSIQKFVTTFIYDPQLWDLPYLNFQSVSPPELSENFFNEHRKVILVPGRFNEQRSRTELLEFLKLSENNDFYFLFAGEMSQSDFSFLSQHFNCFLINRYVSNEELLYLMNKCEFVYAFYTNNRPSGFFGRAIQLNKPIIVRKNSFLHLQFSDYPNLILVQELKQLNFINSFIKSEICSNKYNDDVLLKSIIQSY